LRRRFVPDRLRAPIAPTAMASAAQRGDIVYTSDVGDREDLAGYLARCVSSDARLTNPPRLR
jgi:hypothetical protein